MTDRNPTDRRAGASSALQTMIVFLAACSIIVPGWRLVGDDPFARQAVVWLANVAMLVVIHLGLRARGQTWEHLGVGFRFAFGADLLK